MAQAQGVAELMNSHRKQVRPLAIWGGRENALEPGPTPTPAPPGSPGERGILVQTSSPETLRGGRGLLCPDPLPESSFPSSMGALIWWLVSCSLVW